MATKLATPGDTIKALEPGVFKTLAKVKPTGSLQARKQSTGAVTFYWRYSMGSTSERVAIGVYDSVSPPKSIKPTDKGYSFDAAIRAAEALAIAHYTSKDEGGHAAIVAREKEAEQAKQEQEQADQLKRTATGISVWAEYCEDRRPHWGDRHYQDHQKLVQAGGKVTNRGTKGRGVTIAGPLHDLLAQPLSQLTAANVDAWATQQAKERPTSARLALRCLKAFLNWCSEQPQYTAIMTGNNPAKSKKAREALGKAGVKQDALLREQLPAWFSAVRNIPNPTIAACLQILILTGARLNEIMGMRWEDINTKWRGITIRDKVEGERVIPLTPYVSQLLADLPKRNEWVFASTRIVDMDKKNVKRRARKTMTAGREVQQGEIHQSSESGVISIPRSHHVCACRVAGIDGLTLHGLRRSFKSLSEWLELPTGVVAQIMGHKPSATAEKHYTVRPLDLLRLHHEKFEAWILEQAQVPFVAGAEPAKLRAVN